tara:strand:- start:27226 stop:27741 length:516 start_codon:yes stop_codon:yes gene_type:complete
VENILDKLSSKKIAVCGNNENISNIIDSMSEQIGFEIGKRRGILLCGGMGGVMESASRGAKKSNGITVGILPTSDKSDANSFTDIIIPTSFGKLRNFFIVNLADVVIGISGSWGTLSELSMAMNLNKKVILLAGTGGAVDLLINSKVNISSNTFFVAKDVNTAIYEAFSSH